MVRRISLSAVLVIGAALFGAAPADASSLQNVSAVTLSSTAGSVPHVRYSFSITTSSLLGPTGTITIAAPAGTVMPTGAQLHNDTTNTTISRSGTRTNGNATLTVSLCCSDAINPGDTITVTLGDITNATAGGPYSLAVSTSSDTTPLSSPAYTLGATQPVTGVTAPSLSSTAGGVPHVRYSFSFATSGGNGGLVAPGTITIAAPAGTVMPTVAQLHNDTTNTTISRSGVRSNSNATLTISLCCSDAINPGDTITVTLDDVTNPATGSGYVLNVSTSSNPTPVASPTYTLTAPQQLTGLTAVTTATASNGTVSDVFSFKPSVPTGRLLRPGTITIAGPAGTVMPTVAQIHNDTTNATFTRTGVRSNSNATLTVSLCCSDDISPGDTITVTLDGVVNPAGGPGPFDVSTSSNPLPVTTPPPTATPPPLTPPPAVTPPPGITPPPAVAPAQGAPLPPPPPVIGKTASVATEKGVVLIKRPGGAGFVPLTEAATIPVGSIVDTTHGQVGLTLAKNTAGATQRGSFSQGQFRVDQARKNPLTILSMVGGNLSRCQAKLPSGGAPKQALAAGRRRRTLFSSVHGHFRTRGRNSTATVRGTKWTMTDNCTGTITKVTRGAVTVRDLTLKKNRLVKAGHSYLARAPQRKKKRR